MSTVLGRNIVKDFLRSSKKCIEDLIERVSSFKTTDRSTRFFIIKKGRKRKITINGKHFFLRGSAEYSNPQLTVEELQGIIACRLLEVCGNYFQEYKFSEINKKDIDEICEHLCKPSLGKVVSFLLNTDDIEPDRYSMNPFRESLLQTGQSAFPVANVTTNNLAIDKKFVEKYLGSLISKKEVEMAENFLTIDDYMDMVDSMKNEQLDFLSEAFGIDLVLPSIRLPLTLLKKEQKNSILHSIIRRTHEDYSSIEQFYRCMGRSMKKKTTLLVFPHSKKGYASKRAARGKMYFKRNDFKRLRIKYKTTLLYPNAIDPKDISVAKAEDEFEVDAKKIVDYHYKETPSSPQFILYSLVSPENAVLWHGVGAFGASKLVKSYTSICNYAKNVLFKDLWEKHGIEMSIPRQYNLVPKKMWVHPVYDNIDTSIGCVNDLKELARMGMHLELLHTDDLLRGGLINPS